MSEGIVDPLEIVDIEIEEQNALVITMREFQLLRNGGQKTTAIKEAGEVVGNRQSANFAIEQGLLHGPQGSAFERGVYRERVNSS